MILVFVGGAETKGVIDTQRSLESNDRLNDVGLMAEFSVWARGLNGGIVGITGLVASKNGGSSRKSIGRSN